MPRLSRITSIVSFSSVARGGGCSRVREAPWYSRLVSSSGEARLLGLASFRLGNCLYDRVGFAGTRQCMKADAKTQMLWNKLTKDHRCPTSTELELQFMTLSSNYSYTNCLTYPSQSSSSQQPPGLSLAGPMHTGKPRSTRSQAEVTLVRYFVSRVLVSIDLVCRKSYCANKM